MLAACAARPPAPPAGPPGPIRHVFLVTIDGLLPEAYVAPDAHGLAVPTLRRMVQAGAFSPGALSVFPTVTYPAHTSIATGVLPLRHGIHSNRADDPLETNLDGWRWYAEDIKAPTLWQVAARAGLRTALIGWPVTVGATATYLVPEFWRARHADDWKLLRALSTPGLLADVARRDPAFPARHRPGDFHRDEFLIDIATHVITTGKPHLLFAHLVDVDSAEHQHGPWSDPAKAAIEHADRQLGRLIAAAEAAGIWPATALVVASDHGFAAVRTMVRPGVLLTRAGLVRLDAAGRVAESRAFLQVSGGLGYAYVRDPRDTAAAAMLRAAFDTEAARPEGGIGKIYEPAEIRAAGGDPRASFAFEATPGGSFGPGWTGDYKAPPLYLGAHGFAPEHSEMRAALAILGPAVRRGKIEGARLIDLAPTVAAWLGLRMDGIEGRVIW